MFRRQEEPAPKEKAPAPQERVTSILGDQITWKGEIKGKGGVRIEGLFEGDIDLDGLVVVDAGGRVECDRLKANRVVVAGAVRSDIEAEKVEIRSTGRVWGDVITTSFSTEEGAYLRGTIQMEEKLEAAEEDQEAGEAAEKDVGDEE